MNGLARVLVVALATACFARPTPGRATDADLSGTWLMAQLTTTVSRVPVVGKVYAESRLLSLHQLQHAGERLYGEGRLCALELDSGTRLVRTALPLRAQSSLPAPRVDARVMRDERGQLGFWQPKQLLVVGARLRSPLTDPLPTRPDAPEVYDQDDDGHPGLTVEVRGIAPGRLFVVQRSWTELQGKQVSPDAFAGDLRFAHEQVVLDATSFLLRRTLATEPLLSRSWFRLQRLSPDASCEGAVAYAKEWFR